MLRCAQSDTLILLPGTPHPAPSNLFLRTNRTADTP